ncbi:hypothetical protein CFOL_v3_23321 [Cephalotus follicularis]|uniref:Uncharacterized protein n=1 Tax=Cephalotus follicularis TaxID=3775 RepID=A0A1Q3CIB7_CEPFO|nr:hypothetical protein CFOL_v3_23321 [Cephalotus follicularis]
MRSKSSYPNITTVDFIDIPYTAIHHDASPSIILSLYHRVATQYCTPQTASAVHNKNSAVTLLLKEITNQDIVFKYFEGDYRPREDWATAIYLEIWLEGAKFTTHNQLWVRITNFSSCN